MATLRLSREQNQARLNYAEAEQGRPKVNLMRHGWRFPSSLRSLGMNVRGYIKVYPQGRDDVVWETPYISL